MDRITSIAAVVDPTAIDHPAIDKVSRLARALRAGVELVACDTHFTRAFRGERARRSAQPARDLRDELEALAAPLRSRGLAVETHALAGDPLHECLLDWVEATGASLLVKDTHHHSLARRTVLGNTDWQLIRGCPAPLLLVKPAAWHAPPTLLAAIDPLHPRDAAAALDRRIVEHATTLAEALGGSVHVAHAFVPMMLSAAGADGLPVMTDTSGALLDAESALHRAQVLAVTAPFAIPEARVHVDIGIATEYLPRIATDLAVDVLVTGAIARSALGRLFIGSTAEQVLERMPCDLLVVKPLDFARHAVP